jgi:hypothetical protein
MKILVCGGRNYTNKEKVFEVLNELCNENSKYYNPNDNWLPSDITIITGGCPTGADDLAASFAMVHWTVYKEYKANWVKYGRPAGPIRNQEMIDKEHPDLVVAFPGKTGTADMIRKARRSGIKIMTIMD